MAKEGGAKAVRKRVVATGRVQGVFFRAACASQARRLGLAGAVRNLPDGTVEAVFEGPEAAVEEAVGWCREGPPAARIVGVSVHDEEPRGTEGFRAL